MGTHRDTKMNDQVTVDTSGKKINAILTTFQFRRHAFMCIEIHRKRNHILKVNSFNESYIHRCETWYSFFTSIPVTGISPKTSTQRKCVQRWRMLQMCTATTTPQGAPCPLLCVFHQVWMLDTPLQSRSHETGWCSSASNPNNNDISASHLEIRCWGSVLKI